MKSDFLIIHKSALPELYELIVKTCELIELDGYSVSAACEATGISRSSFYKYRDFVFRPSKDIGKKAVFALAVLDEKGVLSGILNVVYSMGASVVSINQGIPIKGRAYITLTVDFGEDNSAANDMAARFRRVRYVKTVTVVAVD